MVHLEFRSVTFSLKLIVLFGVFLPFDFRKLLFRCFLCFSVNFVRKDIF